MGPEKSLGCEFGYVKMLTTTNLTTPGSRKYVTNEWTGDF